VKHSELWHHNPLDNLTNFADDKFREHVTAVGGIHKQPQAMVAAFLDFCWMLAFFEVHLDGARAPGQECLYDERKSRKLLKISTSVCPSSEDRSGALEAASTLYAAQGVNSND
jgi:hypothetical protein